MTALSQQLATVAEEFGVDHVQVRRDHLISHLLAALGAAAGDQVLFFGGTALARTHLLHGRLSEDLDLVSRSPRRLVAPLLEAALPRAALRSHGRLRWDPSLSSVRDVDAASLSPGRPQRGPTEALPATCSTSMVSPRSALLMGRRPGCTELTARPVEFRLPGSSIRHRRRRPGEPSSPHRRGSR